MRILYHHRTRAEDAQGIHIEAMVKAFRGLGHEVDMVALVDRGGTGGPGPRRSVWDRLASRVPRAGYELMQLAYNVHGYRQLCARLASARYDVIYERYSLNTMCGIWASRRYRVPILLEVNSPLYREERALGHLRLGFVARRSERWICSNSTRTLVVSGVMKSMLEKDGVPAERMAVLPNGVDPDEFHPGISGAAVRRRYGLDGKIVVGVVGWFRPWHGVELLLEAAHRAEIGARRGHLLLIGEGPAMVELRRIAGALAIGEHVTFAGPVAREEVPAHIAAFDIAVQPHATEYASPMKLFEYMAMERCVLAPDQPNIREVVEDRVSAALFEPRSVDRLAARLLDLLEHPDRRQVLARGALENLKRRGFTWRCNAKRALEAVRVP
jgi:glycosyltransferase involved in cell wall biosynthesis